MALKRTFAFVPGTPVLSRRHSRLQLLTKSRPPTFVAPPAHMQLGKILRAMFGGEVAPTEPGKHAVLGTPVAVPALAEGGLETATFGLGWSVLARLARISFGEPG